MLKRIAQLVVVTALIATQTASTVHAEPAPFVYHPETASCSGVPDAQEVAGSWQTDASPYSPRAGDSVSMSLTGSGASLQVTMIFIGPDGEVIDLLDGSAGDGQVVEFTRPVTSPGVYTTVWAEITSGLYITCSGFIAQS